MEKDILIIGGGIVGASLAYELAKYRVYVALIEKEAELSFGVSKANSGIIHAGFHGRPDELKTRLAVRGNALYHRMARDLDLLLAPSGALMVAFPGEREILERFKENGEKLNIPGLEIVDRRWIRKHEPNLSAEIECALLAPTAAVINPYDAIYAFAENAVANGVEVFCDCEVIGIKRKKDLWTVKTTRTEYETRVVINAAGLHADRISRMARIDVPRIIPRKGEEYILDRHMGKLTERVIYPLPQKESKGVLVIPTVDGNTMLGPTAEPIDDREDLSTSDKGKRSVLEGVRRLIPSLREYYMIASFAGLRPATEDGDFHIREDRKGFINIVGIESPGLTAAPAIAEMVVEDLAGKGILVPKRGHVSRRTAIPRFRELNRGQRNALIRVDPEFGEVICRCELVTRKEIREAIRRGARTLDGIKFRTRSQMGRCHGAFCTMKIAGLMAEELGLPYEAITKRGKGSEWVKGHD